MLLKKYLPPSLTNTQTFITLLNTEQIEVDEVNNTIQDIINQCYVVSATWGLTNWESFLRIVTDITKDIDYRRTVVMAKLRGTGTVTVSMIENVASSFSNGQVTVIEHPSIYSFEVQFTGTRGIPPNLTDLENAIEQIKPAHLAVTYTFIFNTYNQVGALTYNSLASYTQDELRTSTI